MKAQSMLLPAIVFACAAGLFAAEPAAKPSWETTPGTYAVFDTSMGRIVCRLFEKETPVTTANFIGLAEGTKEWTDPRTGEPAKKPLYNGTIFHRVIPEFMIQGGDPLGNGTGGPGYRFQDEIVPGLKFDRPGRLAMANAGPGTNGSQFFITEPPTPWLDGRHTIFGQVVEGQQVVSAIARVPRGQMDRPLKDVVITTVTIQRVEQPPPQQGEGKQDERTKGKKGAVRNGAEKLP